MKRYISPIILLCLSTTLCAQKSDSTTFSYQTSKSLIKKDLEKRYFGEGVVSFHCDSLLDSLFIQDKTVNLQQGTKGYRVQLYKSNSTGSQARKEAYAISAQYRAQFPDGDRCYTFFRRPFWIVQVGDFRLHHQALKLKSQLERSLSDIKENISVVPNTVINTQ